MRFYNTRKRRNAGLVNEARPIIERAVGFAKAELMRLQSTPPFRNYEDKRVQDLMEFHDEMCHWLGRFDKEDLQD